MTILSRNEIGTPFSPPRLLLAADESGIVSVNRALWRTSHAPVSLLLIVLLPLYAPHGKLHPKIVQRYRIRFFSSCSLTLPMSFVCMTIQIVRQRSSHLWDFSSAKLVQAASCKGAVPLYPKIFSKVFGASLPSSKIFQARW